MKKVVLGLLSLSIMASGACITGCKCNPNDPIECLVQNRAPKSPF